MTDSTAENNTMVNVGRWGGCFSCEQEEYTSDDRLYSGEPDVKTEQKYPGMQETMISLAETSAALAALRWICSGIKVLGYNMEENRRRGSEKEYIR